MRRIFARVLVTLYLAGCCLLLVFPLPAAAARSRNVVAVTWAGAVLEEDEEELVPLVTGVKDGAVLLEREGKHGEIQLSEEGKAAEQTLRGGTLLELLLLDTGNLSRLERVALYREFGNLVYLDNGYFRYTGNGVERTAAFYADTGILLGELKAGALEAELETLYLTANASFTPENLAGTKVKRMIATKPYANAEGAVLLETRTGLRLYAGLPNAEAIDASNATYCDEGSLAACTSLTVLTLPFLGTREGARGRLEDLFGMDERGVRVVPASLTRVCVKGGGVSSDSFYGCGNLREIELCGVAFQRIAYNAFEDLGALTLLHCPRRNVTLPGEFAVTRLPCGCCLYERTAQ